MDGVVTGSLHAARSLAQVSSAVPGGGGALLWIACLLFHCAPSHPAPESTLPSRDVPTRAAPRLEADTPPPRVAAWTPTGALSTPRRFHSATLLDSGQVLVAGGNAPSDSSASAELFDPTTGRWTPTGAMLTARDHALATRLPSGQVLVAGGASNGTVLATAERYDPRTGLWTATGAMASPREHFTATQLPSGRVLVAGGWDGTKLLETAELYDPGTGQWTATGSLGSARRFHTATLLDSGQVLVVGGEGADRVLATAELYDPATGAWTSTAALDVARKMHTATRLDSGKVLVTGGEGPGFNLDAVELYDPATATWSPAADLHTDRRHHTATLLPSGQVLVTGGTDGDSVRDTSELYDPATDAWAPLLAMTSRRAQHTATLLPSGQVLVVGGWDGTRSLDSAELYVPPDTTPPVAPNLTSPTEDAVLATRAPVLAGQAEPGSTVTVRLDGKAACTALADAHGAWRFTTAAPLSEGPHGAAAVATDAAGNAGPSSGTRHFTVDTTPPAAPEVTSPTQDAFVRSGAPVFAGTAEPGSTVTLALDDSVLGTSPVEAEGTWRFVPASPLRSGPHVVSALATDAVGNTGPTSPPLRFTVWQSPYAGCSASPGAFSAGLWAVLALALGGARRRARLASPRLASRLRPGGHLVVCVGLLLMTGKASAKTHPPETRNPFVPTVASLYDALEFDAALSMIQQAAAWPDNGPLEQCWLALMEGVLRFGAGDDARARRAFGRALGLDPAAGLPVEASPALRQRFAELRRKLGLPERPPPAPPALPAPPAPLPPRTAQPPPGPSDPPAPGVKADSAPSASRLSVARDVATSPAEEHAARALGISLRGDAELLGQTLRPALTAEFLQGPFGAAATVLMQRAPGLRVEARYFLPGERFQPYAALGATAFLPSVGARTAAGLDVRLGALHLSAELAYEHWFPKSSTFARDALLISIGAGWRFSLAPGT